VILQKHPQAWTTHRIGWGESANQWRKKVRETKHPAERKGGQSQQIPKHSCISTLRTRGVACPKGLLYAWPETGDPSPHSQRASLEVPWAKRGVMCSPRNAPSGLEKAGDHHLSVSSLSCNSASFFVSFLL
jgi:hypothetical protein